MDILRTFLAALTICGVAVQQTAAEEPARLPSRENFHLYLLIGQSNMAGRGRMKPEDKPHPRVLKLNKDLEWAPASDPLHFDKPRIAGVGPGSGFGPAMAESDERITIGLIPSAVGGTPLSRWEPGGDLYRQAIVRAKAAMEQGTLKGILWHQGEADSQSLETASTYRDRLAKTILALRKELGAGDVPFVVGELGEFLPADRLPHTNLINRALESLPEVVPATACVKANGLKAKRDGIHFDADSAREFGRRYAQAMLKLQKSASTRPGRSS